MACWRRSASAAVTAGRTGPLRFPSPAGNVSDRHRPPERGTGEPFPFLSLPGSRCCAPLTEVEPESQRTPEVGHSACPKLSLPAGAALTPAISPGDGARSSERKRLIFLKKHPKALESRPSSDSSSEQRHRDRTPCGSLEGARRARQGTGPSEGEVLRPHLPTPAPSPPHPQHRKSVCSALQGSWGRPRTDHSPARLSKPVSHKWGRGQPRWSHSRLCSVPAWSHSPLACTGDSKGCRVPRDRLGVSGRGPCFGLPPVIRLRIKHTRSNSL